MGEAKRAALEQRLIRALEQTLGISMGIRIMPGRPAASRMSPGAWVVLWLAGYGLLLAAVFRFTEASPEGHSTIVSLLLWFALYFAAALYASMATNPKIFETVREDVIPHATDAYLEAVAGDLERHFTLRQRIGVPLLAAAVSTVAALWALEKDIMGKDFEAEFDLPGLLYSDMALWFASYFLCFYCAAAAVVGAQFHRFFARNVHLASSRFYVLAAAETPIVKGLSRLGTQVLVFWVLIFLAIASCMLLTVIPAPYKLKADSQLLTIMIPVSLFFSLGFGTIVYLASEAAIRVALHRFTALQTAALQHRMNALLYPVEGTLPSDTAELDRLIGWHDRITGGGRYGSRIGTAVSITLPLLMPVISLIAGQLRK